MATKAEIQEKGAVLFSEHGALASLGYITARTMVAEHGLLSDEEIAPLDAACEPWLRALAERVMWLDEQLDALRAEYAAVATETDELESWLNV